MQPMSRVLRSLVSLMLMTAIVLGTGRSAMAQETVVNGAVFGTILDETGAPLPGVTITATSPALQRAQTAVTDTQGTYRVANLPAGVYRIEYALSGFQTDVRSNFTLAVGFNARVDLTMKLGAVEQLVEVSGQSPIVDVSTSVVSNTFNRTNLDSVPTSRSIFQAVYLAPGVRPTNTPDVGGSQLGNQQAMGSYGYSGNMVPLVDGVNVLQANSLNGGSSPGDFVDYDSLQELKVISTAADAEAGPPGTVMIAVIKTGGNDYHGDGRIMHQWSGFQATNLPGTFPGGSGANRLQDFSDIFADFGGKVVRDRLWFYWASHFQTKNTAVIGYIGQDGNPGFDLLHQDNHVGKATFQASKNVKLVGFFEDASKIEPERNGSPTVAYASTYNFSDHFRTAKGEALWTPNATMMLDLLGGYYWQPYEYPNQAGQNVAGNPWTFNQTTGISTGPIINVSSGDIGSHNRWQSTGSLTYVPSGKHSYQFGYLAFFPQSDTKENPNHPAGNYQLQVQTINGVITPYQVLTYNFPLSVAGKQNAFGLYVKDTWRVSNRLTVSPGLRFDHYRVYNDEEVQGQGQFSPGGSFPALTVFTWNRFAPRIGTAFDLTGDGKTVIRASYGQYNLDQLGTFDLNFNPAALYTNTYTWNGPNGGCVKTQYTNCAASDAFLASLKGVGSPNYLSTSGGITGVINRNLVMPYFQTATLGFEREMASNMAFRALYVYNRADRLFDQVFPNRGIETYTVPFNTKYPTTDPVNGGQPLTIMTYPASLKTDLGNQTEYVNRNGNPDYFNNYEFTITRRKSGNWSALGAVSLTKNHKWLSTSGVFAANQSAAQPSAPHQTAFPLDETWDYSVKAHFTYDFPRDVNVGLNYRYLAGTPVYATDQIAGVPQLGTVTIPVEAYGTRRNPFLSVLDLRGAKNFNLGGNKRFVATIELFNVTNSDAALAVNYQYGAVGTTRQFGYVSSVIPPMIGRLGVEFKF
ncbi:MAG TPA: TonB-dependent receptor [Vicinamibacterales bacterium]|nr:TonB-dependent receptor [Vicinamibacterales bacterium]